MLISPIGLLRTQCRLQYHHVGSLHKSTDSWSINNQGINYKHGSKLFGHCAFWNDYFQRGRWWTLVGWGCHDGRWVYSRRHARGGVIFELS